jgi:hypothetical protein
VRFSVGANDTHGKRRTNEDKRRAVLMLLCDAEWSKWSNREIARQCGVDDKTVGVLRPPAASAEIPQIAEPARTVSRGGATYQMNTGAIGRREPEPREEQPAPPPPEPERAAFNAFAQGDASPM